MNDSENVNMPIPQSRSTAGLVRYTHDDLRKWGAALDRQMSHGLGETLLCYADDWRESLLAEREGCARVCESLVDRGMNNQGGDCAEAIRMRSNVEVRGRPLLGDPSSPPG